MCVVDCSRPFATLRRLTFWSDHEQRHPHHRHRPFRPQDRQQRQQVARVHGEVFGDIRPATRILEVAKLIDAEAQIEIEADVVVG